MWYRAAAFDGPEVIVDEILELPEPRDPVVVRRVRETVLAKAYGRAPGRAHFHDLRIRVEAIGAPAAK
jgi:hypothetical protein